jgi:signal transduction histidine kinase
LSIIQEGVQSVIVQPYNRLVVDIDASHVEMVIQRLCGLSCRQTTHGSINVSYDYHRGELTIRIEDTGEGIPPERMAHVFDHFTRNKKGELIGSGLDLAIVQLLVKQMGGTIELQSDYDQGTIVWVSIPCTASVIEKKRREV